MTRDWKYILYISLAVGAFVLLKLLSPKQHNWTVTYASDDKNPFGGYAISALLHTYFPKGHVRHSYKTFYELKDSLQAGINVFVVTDAFAPGDEDAIALLDHVHKGGNVFISSRSFSGLLADTLKLATHFNFSEALGDQDSSTLRLVATPLDTARIYWFKRQNIQDYIKNFDTTRTSVIAVNERGGPVTVRMKWGAGNVIINSTPMVFTNIYLLAADNAEFVSAQLSYLPNTSVNWSEYYQRGRREVSTPLRFVLLNEPLRWAYYITLISLLVFMVFEMKRRQRIIPIIPPLPNTTLEFVATIGDLYYQNGDHKNIAEKKISYFLEQVRSKYALATNQLDTGFAVALARKSGRNEEEMTALIKIITTVRNKATIAAETLVALNEKLEAFYTNE